jgi:hypothetical protein
MQQAAVDGITQAEWDAIDARVQSEAAIARTEAGLNGAAGAGKDLADALRDANNAMAGLAGFSANLDKALAVSAAKVDALRRGANAAVAGSIEGMRVDLARREQELVATGMDPGTAGRITQVEQDKLARLATSEEERVRLQESQRGSGGGRGGAAREQEDYLQNLLLEAEHKRRLVGLTEEQTRRQELLFEMEKRKLPVDEERIAMIVATESYTRSLMEAEQQRQQLMQTVEGHIENAFMSMVDGSASVEDAFKGMLRNILLAIYQQEVARPAATAVGTLFRGLLGFADGGAFNKGVQFFANGGVVNSPTMFQHSGGLGVMGEAGAEAIMPLKRGSDGKLGVAVSGGAGGDTVNVHQYFQLSANGDESVRRIVRQEAPRMAEMAKSAVVDAKRRGGSYGRSF